MGNHRCWILATIYLLPWILLDALGSLAMAVMATSAHTWRVKIWDELNNAYWIAIAISVPHLKIKLPQNGLFLGLKSKLKIEWEREWRMRRRTENRVCINASENRFRAKDFNQTYCWFAVTAAPAMIRFNSKLYHTLLSLAVRSFDALKLHYY